MNVGKVALALILIAICLGLAALMPPEESIDCITPNGLALSLRTNFILLAIFIVAWGGLKRESNSKRAAQFLGSALIVMLLSQAHVLDLFGRCP